MLAPAPLVVSTLPTAEAAAAALYDGVPDTERSRSPNDDDRISVCSSPAIVLADPVTAMETVNNGGPAILPKSSVRQMMSVERRNSIEHTSTSPFVGPKMSLADFIAGGNSGGSLGTKPPMPPRQGSLRRVIHAGRSEEDHSTSPFLVRNLDADAMTTVHDALEHAARLPPVAEPETPPVTPASPAVMDPGKPQHPAGSAKGVMEKLVHSVTGASAGLKTKVQDLFKKGGLPTGEATDTHSVAAPAPAAHGKR